MALKKCDKCNLDIKDRHTLNCTFCERAFHIVCTTVSSPRFRIMTIEHKQRWKCDHCYSASRTNLVNSTPENYVTTRTKNKFKINISTENSFSSLSDSEEVGDTVLLTNLELNRSLPGKLNHDKSQEIEELQQKINTLCGKLESAEHEIDNLLSENYALQKQLHSQNLKVDCLSTLSKASPKSRKPCKKNRPKKQLIKTVLDFAVSNDDIEQDTHSINVSNIITTPTEDINKSATVCMVQQDDHLSNGPADGEREITHSPFLTEDQEGTSSAKLSYNKKKILLLADETGRELRNILEKILGEDYTITSVLKPYASLSQIVTNENNNIALCHKEFTKKDYVIILAGTHDRNLNCFSSALDHCFKSLLNTNVLIGKIYNNQCFNVFKLNELIANRCLNMSNVRCLELSFRNNHVIDRLNTCRWIGLDIILLNYKNNQHINSTKTVKSIHTQTEKEFFLDQ